MTIIDDYLEYQENYKNKYGENTCVLMQIGHFFEAYGVDNENEKNNCENLYNLANVMNIQMTRKNKNILENSRSNPLMIGVNLYSIDKYIQLLLNKNYTIVLIEQVTEPPEPERKVTQIYSPGTSIDHLSKSDSNKCVSIYIETIDKISSSKKQINIGLSSIDLSTGQSECYETYSKIDDENYAYDEVFRYIQMWNPKELIIILNNVNKSKKELTSYLELNNRIVHFKDYEHHYGNISYQSCFFEKIYGKNHGMLNIHEYLDIEKNVYSTLSFIYLLEFSHNHNENILYKIEKPTILNNDSHLILTNNTLNQLNIVSNNYIKNNYVFDSVLSVIDKTKTSIGKRYIKDLLICPINNIETLNKRYNIIERLIDKDFNGEIQKILAPIVDIERLHRKISLKMIQPADFVGLLMSYDQISKLLNICNKDKILKDIVPNENVVTKFNEYIGNIKNTFDFDILGKYHLDKINNSFFNKGIYAEVDVLKNKIEKGKFTMENIASKLSFYTDNIPKAVKLEVNERDGYYLTITSKRLLVLKNRMKNLNKTPIKINEDCTLKTTDFEFKNINRTTSRVSCNKLRICSQNVRKNEYEIGILVKDKYMNYLNYLDSNFIEYLKPLINFIGLLDTYTSIGKISMIYGYNRPIIDSQEYSYIEAKGLRHPIIERLQENNVYVTNDILLNKDQSGILLYGTNASGKSSLMKALGCSIILAQAGFYVPCSEFKYSPYKYLFSRINNNDNLFKGESSFAVEMSELRNILKRCNKHSLILGDELCSGTESISALSIFAASVLKLSRMNTNFVFATHLHELSKMDRINALSNISMYHLKVIYDENGGELIYDRKLTPGSGNSIYGLEVCKSMDMDSEFLEEANRIRQEIMGIKETILEYKPSKYNSKLIVDKCELCSSDAEDTHHIKFQCTSDKNGIIDGYIQKDSKSNLVPLCKICHDKIHNNLIEVNGYKDTSQGPKLIYKEIKASEKKNNKKFSKERIVFIKDFIEKNTKVNNKTICSLLESNYNIRISSSTLGKIKKGSY